MNNISINIVSRIADDKNYFIDLLLIVYKLKYKHGIIIQMNFIGQIYSYSIFRTLERFCIISGIYDQINFTKTSIPISELSKGENDYYLSLTVGNAIGYAGIECLKNKFKTIFYNVEPQYNFQTDKLTFSSNLDDLEKLIIQIHNQKESTNLQIEQENTELLNSIKLDQDTIQKLIGILQ